MTKNNTMSRTNAPRPSVVPGGNNSGGGAVRNTQTNEAAGDGKNDTPVIGLIDEGTASLISEAPKPSGKLADGNIFAAAAVSQSEKASRKQTLLSATRQQLAHSADLFREGGDKAAEAQEIVDKAAVTLYQARISGTMSGDELNALCGDIWGYKAKGSSGIKTPVAANHPQASKTPFGPGEALRKRLVRAVGAAEYANGTGAMGGAFFEGLPVDDVKAVLAQMEAGNLGFWAAYERFGELRKNNMEPVAIAFDPKKIANLVGLLGQEGAAETIAQNPSLITAYGALLDMLAVIGKEVNNFASKEVKEAIAA